MSEQLSSVSSAVYTYDRLAYFCSPGRGEMHIEYLLERQGRGYDSRLAIEPNATAVLGYEFNRPFRGVSLFQEYDDRDNLHAAAIVAENIGSMSQMVTINQVGRLVLSQPFHGLNGYDGQKQAFTSHHGSLQSVLDARGNPVEEHSKPKTRNYTLQAMRWFLDYYIVHGYSPLLDNQYRLYGKSLPG